MKTNKIIVAVVALAIGATAFQSCKPSSKGKIDGEWTVNLMSGSSVSEGTSTQSGVSGTYTNSGTSTYNFDGSAISSDASYTYTDTDNDVSTSSSVMDAGAGTWTWTDTYNGVSASETGAYSSEVAMTYSFVKDGTYSSTDSHTSQIVETETDPTGTDDFFQVVTTVVTTTDEVSSNTTQGEWSFMGKNKSAELKANERIALTYLSATDEITTTETIVTTVVDNVSGASTTETEVEVISDDVSYTYTSTDVDEIWKITESKNKSLKAEFTEDYTSSSSSSNANTFDGLTITTTSTGTSTVTGTGTIEMTQE
jgi:hypothetical protein